MTTPVRQRIRIGGTVVGAKTNVLLNRTIYVEDGNVSGFGDQVWDLSPAIEDRHSAGQALHWNRFPDAFREACKIYVFALVNVVEDAPRLPFSRSDFPHIKTIWGEMGPLFIFCKWLEEENISGFDQVTVPDLNRYLSYVTEKEGASSSWKRVALLAVQRLQVYREVLPPECRLPSERIWGGESAAELAQAETPWHGWNKTPRISPQVMETLLSAALLVVDTIAADVVPVASRILEMRSLAHQVAPDIRRRNVREVPQTAAMQEQLSALLMALRDKGRPLPGIHEGGAEKIDLGGLAVGGWMNYSLISRMPLVDLMLGESGLPIEVGMFRVEKFSSYEESPWRSDPLSAEQVVGLLRHITAACFIIIVYLSGIRTGEALNLQRGCISRDEKLGLTFLAGQQLKTRDDRRRERSRNTIPWVVTDETAKAVGILEKFTNGSLLFPGADFCSEERFVRGSLRTRTIGSISSDMVRFIKWFNDEVAPTVHHPLIANDPLGKITGRRFRRTLAWHIVRRPGGTVAGAKQYGHLRTQVTQGYAGQADAGFTDEITMEEFLLRAETIHEDSERLKRGEHVSGPAADEYRDRVSTGAKFAGLAVPSRAVAEKALTNRALEVHHGALVTCVYRAESAACRSDDNSSAATEGPTWRHCRLNCVNAARTDRDIANVRKHIQELQRDLSLPGMPGPLEDRIAFRLGEHRRFLEEHDRSKPNGGKA
jgi:integrase